MAEKTYLLRRIADNDHKTIKRRALNAGVSMRQYILDMALYGKVQHKKPK
jgi:predicted HicB family RNase H-like nuclease